LADECATAQFVNALPVHGRFLSVVPVEIYKPVPDDWFVAVTDVVQSRQAISQGRYKAVNMAGVSMISAIMNGIGHQDVLYIFGGDGAAVAFSPEDRDVVNEALSAVVGWAEDELQLQLRAAIVPVHEIRKQGHDLLVAAVRVSEAIRNFAFMGGGIAFAEKLMKDGVYRTERAPAGVVPDLAGLSCRWKPVEEPGYKIVSLILEPAEGSEVIPTQTVEELMELVHADSADSSPVSESRLGFTWPPKGIGLEARATGDSLFKILLITGIAWLLNLTGWSMGSFDPNHYRKTLALNTDYRKIQDGIRMTVSMKDAEIQALRTSLEKQRLAGNLRFGICEQDQAMLTCFVPSVTSDDHFHFLDGAGGGYAAAADDLS